MSIVSTLSDREALEQFQAQHPSFKSLGSLIAVGEAQFVGAYAIAFDGAASQARRVFQTAALLQEKLLLAWANLTTASSPYLQQTRFNNIPTEFLDYYKSIPGFERLFGSQDYVECDDCRSVFGPSAYFADLMRFVEMHITQSQNPQSSIPLNCKLRDRRPDLWNLKLDCENTNQLIPYIDIVNEVLEQFLLDNDTPSLEVLYSQLSTTPFPMTLPYSRSLNEIRNYLQPFKTSLPDLYRAFSPDVAAINTQIVREQLALSPSEFDLLTADSFTPANLARMYGVEELSSEKLTGLDQVKTFLDRTGLTRKQLDELLHQDLDQTEIDAGYQQLFFINNVSDGLGPLTIDSVEVRTAEDPNALPIEQLVNLSLPKLDRIYRFLKLVRKLGWSFTDLDTALRSLLLPYPQLNQLNQLNQLASNRLLQFGGDSFIACRNVTQMDVASLTIEALICPTQAAINPIVFKGTEAATSVPEQLHFSLYLDEANCLCLKTATSETRTIDSLPLNVMSRVAVTLAPNQIAVYVNDRPMAIAPPCYRLTEQSRQQLMQMSPPPVVGSLSFLREQYGQIFRDSLTPILAVFNGKTYSSESDLVSELNRAISSPSSIWGWGFPFFLEKYTVIQSFGAIVPTILNLTRIPTAPTSFTPVGRDFNIGSNSDRTFVGYLRHIRIWNGIKTADQIAQSDPQSLTGEEEELLGYWTLREADQRRLEQNRFFFVDRTANHNDGSFVSLKQVSPTWVLNLLSRSTNSVSQSTTPRLISQSDLVLPAFGATANQHPSGWVDTGASFSLDRSEAFQVFGDKTEGFGTTTTAEHIHSHYIGGITWSNYALTGRMRVSDAKAGIGVTILSGYPQMQQYYRLRAWDNLPFELAVRTPANPNMTDNRPIGTLPLVKGTVGTSLQLTANVWFRFRLEVEDTGNATLIRAKIWQDETDEPTEFQINAIDDNLDRLTQGTIGIWTAGAGTKQVADLQVRSLKNDANQGGISANLLAQLASIQQLQQQSKWSIEQLTSLWSLPKAIGKNDGVTLFDQVFNPEGVGQTTWHDSLSLQWTIRDSANPEYDRQIRTRLMTVLGISSIDLDRLVQRLSGSQTVIEVNSRYLERLYRLIATATLLRLRLSDFLLLLDRVRLPQVQRISEIQRLQGVVTQLKRTGFTPTELFNLAQPRSTSAPLPIAADLRSLAIAIQQQSLDPDSLPDNQTQPSQIAIAGLAEQFQTTPDLLQLFVDALKIPNLTDRLRSLKELSIPVDLQRDLLQIDQLRQWLSKFNLDLEEIRVLLERPQTFGIAQILAPSLKDLGAIATFIELRDAFADTNHRLLSLLSMEDSDRIGAIVELTNWEERPLRILMQHWQTRSDQPLEQLQRLKTCFDIAQTIGVGSSFLIRLTNTDQLDDSFYQEQSANLLNALRAANRDEKQWQKVYKPIRDRLALDRRDALLSQAMLKIGASFDGRKDPNLLYEFLLVDPQTGSEIETSRIVQAAASLQLYIQRFLLGLEQGSDQVKIPIEEWEWMKNYRVWEANRKIFLYPENYLEPQLRSSKTQMFTDLEQALMQAELTPETIETAYRIYLDKFREVADLTIVGSYLYRDRKADNNDIGSDDKGVLYLIGCSKSQPKVYYYRTLIVETNRWTPWQKIDLAIDAQFVAPVFAFNRLFIFWVEFIKSAKAVKVGDSYITSDVFKPVLKYSYYNFNKSWIPPQVYAETTYELTKDDTFKPAWQRIYAQRISAINVTEAPRSLRATQDVAAKVLVMKNSTNVVKKLPSSSTDTLNFTFWLNWQSDFPGGPGFPLIVYNGSSIVDLYTQPIPTSRELSKMRFMAKIIYGDVAELDTQSGAGGNNAGRGWQHISIAIEYITQAGRQGYQVSVIQNQTEILSTFVVADRLSPNGSLSLGQQGQFLGGDYVQISNFAVWDRVLTLQELDNISKRRLDRSDDALLYIPCNTQEPESTMELADSNLNFAIQDLPEVKFEGERLVLLYGQPTDNATPNIQTIRNNLLEDQVFQLKIGSTPLQGGNRVYDLDLSNNFMQLLVTLSDSLSFNDYYARGSSGNSQRSQFTTTSSIARVASEKQVPSPRLATPLLNSITPRESFVFDVGNQAGWYVLQTGDEQFLIRPTTDSESLDLESLGDQMQFWLGDNSGAPVLAGMKQSVTMFFQPDARLITNQPNDNTFPKPAFKYRFDRINSSAVHDLSEALLRGGIDGLLSWESQTLPESDFSLRYSPVPELVFDPSSISKTIDFNGANGLYYWEIFFHIPFLIANRLNANRQFSEAQRWYHYLFNPTAQDGIGKDRYWRFSPFRKQSIGSIDALLNNRAALAEYRDDPGDPHAIARLRVSAYQKAIVMKYIDNLIDWGDNLFEQDTRESINEATMLYVLGYSLLGARPEARPNQRSVEVGTYSDIVQAADNREFITQVAPPSQSLPIKNQRSLPYNPHTSIVTTFCVPENETFLKYWNRVEDRLYKIRHSLNLEGIFRQLALFAPEIDPMMLAQAAAGGRGIGGAMSDQATRFPNFRFTLLIEKASDMASTTIDLGLALLSALERRDAEQLAVLQTTQEQIMLNLMLTIQQNEVTAAKTELEALTLTQQSLQYKKGYYEFHIANPLNALEGIELGVLVAAMIPKTLAIPCRMGESIAGATPTGIAGGAGVASPVVATIAGDKATQVFGGLAELFSGASDLIKDAAEILGKGAEYERRTQEWVMEKTLADYELQEVGKQIELAKLKITQAEQELKAHEQSIKHSQEVAAFYRSKFSNQELYSWIATRLSTLYFQTYNLAYSMAKSAEKALQFELPTTEKFITFGNWDSLRKGLLAGEALKLDLHRMEKFNLDQDRRWLSIEKRISMQRSFSDAFNQLKQNETCQFTLTEQLFDRDYRGHYCRQIKTLGISIKFKSIGGLPGFDPYDAVHATLTQLSHQLLLQPDLDAVKFLMNPQAKDAKQPNESILRTDWRALQQIAISKVPEASSNETDLGIFSLDFVFDAAYFPFENTGAISSWQLDLPKATNSLVNFEQIEDVIIYLRYTARSDQGLKAGVEELLKP